MASEVIDKASIPVEKDFAVCSICVWDNISLGLLVE
jgi:hypothetical protein